LQQRPTRREVGTRRLLAYEQRRSASHITGELHDVRALVADDLYGIIDTMIRSECELSIEMFYRDEINEEAALFATWAYKLIHDTLVPVRYEVAVAPLSWLLILPYALEILSQTQVDTSHWTDVSTTCIYLPGLGNPHHSSFFTCRFHSELMADIRDIGNH
jgi:hypothetical protein